MKKKKKKTETEEKRKTSRNKFVQIITWDENIFGQARYVF